MDEIPDLLVEQLAAGLLPPQEAAALRRQLERDGDTRLDEIAASDAEILEQYPPEMMAARLQRRLEPQAPAWRHWMFMGTTVAAMAAAMWWMTTPSTVREPGETPQRVARAEVPSTPSIGSPQPSPLPREPGIRTKGTPRLLLHRKTPGGSRPLRPGDTVAGGQFIRIGYQSGGARYGVIVSIDGAGAVTLHEPGTVEGPTELADGPTWLDFSFELDEAPGFERFLFVTAMEPLDPGEVLEMVHVLADSDDRRNLPLALPEAWSHASFLLAKPE